MASVNKHLQSKETTVIPFPLVLALVGALSLSFVFALPRSTKSISSLIDFAFFPLLNVTKINKSKALFSQFRVVVCCAVRMGFESCVSEIFQVYNDNSNQCSGWRFNDLFWIAFDSSSRSVQFKANFHNCSMII